MWRIKAEAETDEAEVVDQIRADVDAWRGLHIARLSFTEEDLVTGHIEATSSSGVRLFAAPPPSTAPDAIGAPGYPPYPDGMILLVEVGSTAHGTGLPGGEDHDETAVVVETTDQVLGLGPALANRMQRTRPEELIAAHGYDTKFAMHPPAWVTRASSWSPPAGSPLPVGGEAGEWLRSVRRGEMPYDDCLNRSETWTRNSPPLPTTTVTQPVRTVRASRRSPSPSTAAPGAGSPCLASPSPTRPARISGILRWRARLVLGTNSPRYRTIRAEKR